MVDERIVVPRKGWGPLAAVILLILAGPLVFGLSVGTLKGGAAGSGAVVGVLLLATGIVMACGFLAIAPNDARVMLLFGQYKGTIKESGFFWVNPFYTVHKVTLRVRNFETGSTTGDHLHRSRGKASKVNDRNGNPIEISAVVVWRVVNTAEAMFEVDNYENYVEVQSEAALRDLAGRYPYDTNEDHDEVSLRGDTTEVSARLKDDIQERLHKAGVEVIEARISHLAYAPEIAAAMLQRQQAQAVVAARTKIVEGAVGMVEMALGQLAEKNLVEFDPQRRANMVANLLVVLCSDRHTQPVVQTGSVD